MHSESHKTQLILASSSPYRKILLKQLNVPFETHAPNVDESALPGENLQALVARLARKKGQTIAQDNPASIVIGSDQLADCNGQKVGKPESVENAIAQLQQFSGQSVHFYTAIAILCIDTSYCFERTVITHVQFRTLEDEEIRRYVAADRPLDCAGSFKSEALGISLLNQMTSDDPTAIVGLPLIALSQGLREAGFHLP
jgi:septum formation protein